MTYQTSISLRRNSCVDSIAINARSFLKILLYWSQGLNQSEICKVVQISRPTLTKIRNIFTSKIVDFFIRFPIRLGGPGITVQCDEVMLNHKVKSHRGRGPREKVWALVIVDTSTSPSIGFVKIVENRSKEVLLPIIKNVVREGSVIHTDEWASYRELAEHNSYAHASVVHKYNFV
jgi:hypothetical protein